jgi:predicted SAM-dependent methyltransferase
MKLNLGCGKSIMDGFINIDIVASDGVDVVMDLSTDILPYTDVEYINCQDILEHLYRDKQEWFLRSCYSSLMAGGQIYIQVPNLEILAKMYCDIIHNPTEIQVKIDVVKFSECIYGGGNSFDSHKWGYDQYSLRTVLESIGFTIIGIGSDGGQNLLCLAKK